MTLDGGLELEVIGDTQREDCNRRSLVTLDGRIAIGGLW